MSNAWAFSTLGIIPSLSSQTSKYLRVSSGNGSTIGRSSAVVCGVLVIGSVLLAVVILSHRGQAHGSEESVGSSVLPVAEHGDMRVPVTCRPMRGLHHHPAAHARPPLPRAYLERVDHGDALMPPGIAHGGGAVVMPPEEARLGAGRAFHHRDAIRSDAALGPDFAHDFQRFPDRESGDTRCARAGQRGDRG